uniref:Uncharacterized protein n=1 Tax=Anopheles melas TaxID=34690 RepID=A0A182U1L4_9DIPT
MRVSSTAWIRFAANRFRGLVGLGRTTSFWPLPDVTFVATVAAGFEVTGATVLAVALALGFFVVVLTKVAFFGWTLRLRSQWLQESSYSSASNRNFIVVVRFGIVVLLKVFLVGHIERGKLSTASTTKVRQLTVVQDQIAQEGRIRAGRTFVPLLLSDGVVIARPLALILLQHLLVQIVQRVARFVIVRVAVARPVGVVVRCRFVLAPVGRQPVGGVPLVVALIPTVLRLGQIVVALAGAVAVVSRIVIVIAAHRGLVRGVWEVLGWQLGVVVPCVRQVVHREQ